MKYLVMLFWYSGILVFRYFDMLVFRYSGILIVCYFDIWYSDILAFWHISILIFWYPECISEQYFVKSLREYLMLCFEALCHYFLGVLMLFLMNAAYFWTNPSSDWRRIWIWKGIGIWDSKSHLNLRANLQENLMESQIKREILWDFPWQGSDPSDPPR